MTSKLNEGVGKKIVAALKQQSEQNADETLEISSNAVDGLIPNVEDTINNALEDVFENNNEENENSENEAAVELVEDSLESINTFAVEEQEQEEPYKELSFESDSFDNISIGSFVQPDIEQSTIAFEQKEVDLPSNIVILKRLISQLPSGVTRHTGAQIIRQTMEALGLSMKSVLREAQEVQENLKESSKECQKTIQEYKKQILQLEKQSQNYQKQYGALNDLISLFIQTK